MLAEVLIYGVLSLVVFKGFGDAMAVVTGWGFTGFSLMIYFMGITDNNWFFLGLIVTMALIVISTIAKSYNR